MGGDGGDARQFGFLSKGVLGGWMTNQVLGTMKKYL